MNEYKEKVRNNRMLRRGLTPKALGLLEELDEQVVVLKACLVHYNKDKIEKKLEVIDRKIEMLQKERSIMVEKQYDVADKKTQEYENRLEENLEAQRDIILSHQSLAKLAKALKEIEKYSKMLETA